MEELPQTILIVEDFNMRNSSKLFQFQLSKGDPVTTSKAAHSKLDPTTFPFSLLSNIDKNQTRWHEQEMHCKLVIFLNDKL